jgi:5-(aminomethyl)-3-furanmethanol phosphate kinase
MGAVDAVVKVGGGLLGHPSHFDRLLRLLADVGRTRKLLVVPGGGPFADAIREVDRRLNLSDDAAHWMAVLAMDQYGHLIASRLADSVLVAGPLEIKDALARASVAVLAPYLWLRDADPLPHSWDVTSDSIAAWIAGELGAPTLVLVKPPGMVTGERVDAYFTRSLPANVAPVIVPVDRIDALRSALHGE